MEKSGNTSNIVARKDGQVEIIEPYKGSAAIKSGQTVMQGSLLVSGVTQVRNGMSVFTDADGYVVARTKINVSVPIKEEITVLKPKTKKIYSLYILGREISLARRKKADIVYRHKSWLYLHGIKMPFGIFYTQYTDFEEEKIKVDKKTAELAALGDYAVKSYHETLHAQIISQNIEIKNGSVAGEYDCYENICQRVEFETEETEPLSEE